MSSWVAWQELHNISTSQDAKKRRLHLKFLTGDFLSNERLSIDQPNLSPACSLCDAPVESIEHILVVCRATSEVRNRLLPELMNVVASVQPTCQILKNNPTASILSQFILDCTSLNLPESIRVPAHNPGISAIYRVSRDWCFAANSDRSNCLKTVRNWEWRRLRILSSDKPAACRVGLARTYYMCSTVWSHLDHTSALYQFVSLHYHHE